MASSSPEDAAFLDAQARESKVPLINALWSIPIPIILAFTGLRFYIKLRGRKIGITLDDCFILLASVGFSLSIRVAAVEDMSTIE
jgi:hypothetical protein